MTSSLRCGMIYMEPLQLGWEPLLTSWLAKDVPDFVLPEQKNVIRMLCEWLLPPCLDYVTKHCKHFVKCHPMHLTTQLLRLYSCMMDDIKLVHYDVIVC